MRYLYTSLRFNVCVPIIFICFTVQYACGKKNDTEVERPRRQYETINVYGQFNDPNIKQREQQPHLWTHFNGTGKPENTPATETPYHQDSSTFKQPTTENYESFFPTPTKSSNEVFLHITPIKNNTSRIPPLNTIPFEKHEPHILNAQFPLEKENEVDSYIQAYRESRYDKQDSFDSSDSTRNQGISTLNSEDPFNKPQSNHSEQKETATQQANQFDSYQQTSEGFQQQENDGYSLSRQQFEPENQQDANYQQNKYSYNEQSAIQSSPEESQKNTFFATEDTQYNTPTPYLSEQKFPQVNNQQHNIQQYSQNYAGYKSQGSTDNLFQQHPASYVPQQAQVPGYQPSAQPGTSYASQPHQNLRPLKSNEAPYIPGKQHTPYQQDRGIPQHYNTFQQANQYRPYDLAQNSFGYTPYPQDNRNTGYNVPLTRPQQNAFNTPQFQSPQNNRDNFAPFGGKHNPFQEQQINKFNTHAQCSDKDTLHDTQITGFNPQQTGTITPGLAYGNNYVKNPDYGGSPNYLGSTNEPYYNQLQNSNPNYNKHEITQLPPVNTPYFPHTQSEQQYLPPTSFDTNKNSFKPLFQQQNYGRKDVITNHYSANKLSPLKSSTTLLPPQRYNYTAHQYQETPINSGTAPYYGENFPSVDRQSPTFPTFNNIQYNPNAPVAGSNAFIPTDPTGYKEQTPYDVLTPPPEGLAHIDPYSTVYTGEYNSQQNSEPLNYRANSENSQSLYQTTRLSPSSYFNSFRF